MGPQLESKGDPMTDVAYTPHVRTTSLNLIEETRAGEG